MSIGARARPLPGALRRPVLVLWVCSAAAGPPGCASLSSVTRDDLAATVRSQVATGRSVSIAVAAVRGGEVVALEAAGSADLASGRAATPDTVYMLFSLSKLVTATAVMQLWDRGLLDLDRPIRSYLPELAIRGASQTPITARHLLAHSSGLPNPSPFQWARPLGQRRPRLASFLASVLDRYGYVVFEPGSGFLYSNLGYLVLGRLVERVSGQPYEAYVRRSIFEPLGMRRAAFDLDRRLYEDVATGYVRSGTREHALGRLLAGRAAFGKRFGDWVSGNPFVVDGAPYGGMVGSARDLARFVAMHLGGGAYRGRSVLSERASRAMQEEQRTTSGCVLPFTLGWHAGSVAGNRYLEHRGSGGGYRPALRIYPDLGYGVVVLTNVTRFDPSQLEELLVRSPRRTDGMIPGSSSGDAVTTERGAGHER